MHSGEEYAKKSKQIETQAAIERSTAINRSRLEKIKSRQERVSALSLEVSSRFWPVSARFWLDFGPMSMDFHGFPHGFWVRTLFKCLGDAGEARGGLADGVEQAVAGQGGAEAVHHEAHRAGLADVAGGSVDLLELDARGYTHI